MKANQANQDISNLGKDNVSKKPLDAAKNKWSLWSLFLFNIKFSVLDTVPLSAGREFHNIVTRFYLGYTFGIDLHARKISCCMVDNQYKEGVGALPQPKTLWLKNSEVHSSLMQHIGNSVRRD